MWNRILANKFVVAIIVIAVIVCLCWILGVGFHASVGQGGGDIGFTHSK